MASAWVKYDQSVLDADASIMAVPIAARPPTLINGL